MTTSKQENREATSRGGSFTHALRTHFSLADRRGQAAVISAGLFIATPILAVFASKLFLLLLVPAVLLSVVGLPRLESLGRARSAPRIGATGLVMTFNGIALMVSLFVVGFTLDFLVSGRAEHTSIAVAYGYTTVHIMLGVGLMLYDNYRHTQSD